MIKTKGWSSATCTRVTHAGIWRAQRVVTCASVALLLLATPLASQVPGMNASTRFGIAMTDNHYSSNCGAVTGAYSVEVQGRHQWFPQLTVDKFSGSGMGGTGCGTVPPSVGGLQVDGATRVGLGGGARIGSGKVQLEGALLGGIIAGRRGFAATPSENNRVVVPHFGGQATLVLFRYAVFSGAYHRTRLTLDGSSADGGSAETRRIWSPMYTWQAGVRVPLGPR